MSADLVSDEVGHSLQLQVVGSTVQRSVTPVCVWVWVCVRVCVCVCVTYWLSVALKFSPPLRER